MKWNLFSLTSQNVPLEYETIVLNDGLPDETESLCRLFEQKLDLKYVFTGERNLTGKMKYRVPGFALNIGARISSGEILVFCCAEMFHINRTIAQLIQPVVINPKCLGTSIGMDDDGSFLHHLEQHAGSFDLNTYLNSYPRLNTTLPFLMAIDRNEFFSIGGCDEDFTGLAYDDNDLMSRLAKNGCRICLTQAKTIHLYHPRHDDGKELTPEYLYNARLYRERQDQIVRNQGREWGQLDMFSESIRR